MHCTIISCMKKFVLFGLLSLSVVLLFNSCNKNNDENSITPTTVQPVFEPEKVGKPVYGNLEPYTYGSSIYALPADDYYKLNYKVQIPEPVPVEKRINTKTDAAKSGSTSAKAESKDLKSYKISYNTKRKEVAEVEIAKSDNKASTDKNELKIIDWGPQDEILSAITRPTFYVIFSEPVKALTALPAPSDKSDIMTISPAIKGVFHWYGTNQLNFECSENADPCVTYTIQINDKLTSLSGHKITGDKIFSTVAQDFSFSYFPGYTKNEVYKQLSDGIIPQYAKNLMIYVPTPLSKEEFQKIFKIKNLKTGKNLPYSAETDKDNPLQKFYLTISEEVPLNTEIELSILASKKAGEIKIGKKATYFTLRPFQIESIENKIGISNTKNINPIKIKFNQIPDATTLKNNITVQYKAKDADTFGEPVIVTEENMTLTGKNLIISNPDALKSGTKGKISINNKVKDIYGQTIDSALLSGEFSIPSPKSYFKLCDTGNRMMEAKYPHRLALAYQNLYPNSQWVLNKINNPLVYSYKVGSDVKLTPKPNDFNTNIRDQQIMEYIPMDSLLDDGLGWVTFSADYSYEHTNWRGEKEIQTDWERINVQVTDLGVTARLGINKAVVLVKTLSTDEPVENAEVSIYMNNVSNTNLDPLTVGKLGIGKTDKNGYAVINISDENSKIFEKAANANSAQPSPAILVTSGKDKITFIPTDHNWGYALSEARKIRPTGLLFTDRGIFEPGETVTFRGYDKNLHMGKYTSYQGEYEVLLKSSYWNDNKTYAIRSGNTSEHGGYSGSIELPSDLEPRTYELKYYRVKNAGREYVASCYFRVEYFEPESMQANISMPEYIVYGGDSISSEITASYLAGGAIADAQIDNSWYSQPTYFHSELPEAKGLSFGPTDSYDYRKFLSEDKTTLSADGTGTASITTAKITNGVPYTFTLESEITDVSNHTTMAKKTITVYPSKFNIGLGLPTMNGFPEIGRKIDLSYLIVTPDDQIASAELIDGNIQCEINHITWEVSNENGINDEIYSSYHRVKNVIKTDSIPAKNQGIYSFTPDKSGSYCVKFSASDKKGNKAITEYEFYVTGKDSWYNPDSSEKITLTTDKKMYNPGEVAKILVNSPIEAGDYLITIEREGIFTEELRHLDKPTSIIEVPVAANYLPYAMVCLSSYSKRTNEPENDFGEKDMNKPSGVFGMTTLHVNPYNMAFSIDIESDKTIYRPGDTASIKLKATKNGNPVPGAALTVLGVDRAILDIINYHVPNPIDYFYSEYRFRHCVRGGDSRNMLMDPVTYAIKSLQGGDADATKEEQRKDFRSTAFFVSEQITDENGETTITFKVPSQLTTFRVTAVGAHGEMFGYEENEFGVRNPINVQSVQPKKLRVRDTAECGVLITNLGKEEQKVTVEVEIRNPEVMEDEDSGLAATPGKIFIDDKTEKSVIVQGGASSVIYFNVGAESAGKQVLVYHVKSDVLNEALYSPVTIEQSYSYETVSLNGSTDKNSGELIAIPSWSDDGMGQLSVTLDATRLGMLSSGVNYVFDYPYGCFEQISSKLLPLIVFEKYIDVFGLESKVSNPKNVVKSNIRKMAKYQKPDGGFGYWPDSLESNFYVSLRIADLYQTAIERGYTKAELAINYDKLVSFITTILENTSYISDSNLAYAYYVLGKANGTDYSKKADQIFDTVKGKDLDSMALCGLIYASNNPGKCESTVKEIRKYLQDAGQGISVSKLYYNSETLAHILKLLVLQDKNAPIVDKVLFTLLKKQQHGYWSSTRQTAAVLDAVYTYIQVRNLDAVDFNAHCELSGIRITEGQFNGPGAKPVTVLKEFTSDELKALPRDKNLNLEFAKEGKGTLYYSTVMKYALPDELQNARDEGLGITVEFTDVSTDKVISPSADSKVMELEAGKTYNVKIVLTSTKTRDFLALRAPIPSGASILNANFANVSAKNKITTSSSDQKWWRRRITSQALYDNEGQFFWDTFEAGSYTLEFKMRTSRRGVYPVPPVTAECMYEPEIFGRSDGYLFVIK